MRGVVSDRSLAVVARQTAAWRRRVGACACSGLVSCAAGGARDTVPESRDVRVLDAGSAMESAQGYEYVARRSLSLVALAEARGIAPEVAREAVDRLADALEACTIEEGRRGSRIEGAARVVASVEADGTVGAPTVRIDPGAGVAQSAVLCLVAPVRTLTFPAVDGGVRGIAVEALWGRLLGSAGRQGDGRR
jgi:hypothetical protein